MRNWTCVEITHWPNLSRVYIGKGYAGDSDTHYLLALATLGIVTEIEMILIAKVSEEGNIMTRYRRHFNINLANVNEPLFNTMGNR
jgi:hypothetical protein